MKNKVKYIAISNVFIIVCLVLVFLFPIGAGAEETNPTDATNATEYTTESTTEATEMQPTTITLKTYKTTLYVKNTYTIKPTVTNAVGSVQFTSKSNKIATVTAQGVVTAKKAGTTIITVENNGATANFKVTVKNPYITRKGKAVTNVTVRRNKFIRIRIKGKIVSESHTNTKYAKVTSRTGNVLNIKGARVTAKNKPTVLKIKVNGVTLKLKVKVITKTKYQKYVNVAYKHTKPKINRIYKNTINLKGLYKVKTNLDRLHFRKGKKGITVAQCNYYEKVAKKATYSVSNNKVLSLDKKKRTVKCIGTGKAVIAIRFNDGTVLKTTVNVTKPATMNIHIPYSYWGEYGKEIRYSDETYPSRVCYNYEDIYIALRDEFYNHIIKGEYPEYPYLTCAFGKTDTTKLDIQFLKKATRDYDDGYNFYTYICRETSALQMEFDVLADGKTILVGINEGTVFQFDSSTDYISEFKNRLQDYKKVYTAAMEALKEMDLESCTEDYQKVFEVAKYMKSHYRYESDNMQYTSHYSIIVEQMGVCHDWTNATDYFLTLLHIPSYFVSGNTEDGVAHAWNVVKVQGKWYHVDILWNTLFYGNKHIETYKWHKEYEPFFGVSKLEDEDFIYCYPQRQTEKTRGLNRYENNA